MVLPILSYGAEILGFMEDSSLEAVELHYLKHILHVPLTASNIAVRGELGQLRVWVRDCVRAYVCVHVGVCVCVRAFAC